MNAQYRKPSALISGPSNTEKSGTGIKLALALVSGKPLRRAVVSSSRDFAAIAALAARLGLPDPLDGKELVCAWPHQEVPAEPTF